MAEGDMVDLKTSRFKPFGQHFQGAVIAISVLGEHLVLAVFGFGFFHFHIRENLCSSI